MESSCIIEARVVPRAQEQKVLLQGEIIKIRIVEAPIEGKGNEAVCRILANSLKIPKYLISIRSGHKSKNKRILIEGLSEYEVKKRLSKLAD
jgi:hypothetical protein